MNEQVERHGECSRWCWNEVSADDLALKEIRCTRDEAIFFSNMSPECHEKDATVPSYWTITQLTLSPLRL